MTNEDIKETPLAARHVALGGKMVPFAGWNMPVQYTGIMDEHKAVRTACGIFDISHMGQFFAEGSGVAEWLNGLLTNNIHKLDISQGQYSIMTNDKGGVIDDLILYRCDDQRFFIVVNASKIDEDYVWMSSHKPDTIVLDNQSDAFAGMAVQGPLSNEVFSKVVPGVELPPRNGVKTVEVGGETIWLCRTGYTGEDGFEFFCPSGSAEAWLDKFIQAGAKPCGLGARDSLRMEMCYPLNGSDLSPERTPLEAGLGFFCDLTKEFPGVEVLRKQKEEGVKQRLCAMEYTDKGAPPRSHYTICLPGGDAIGELSSGVLSPSLGKGIGMGYLPVEYATVGTNVEIEVRGKRFPAVVVKKPFYKKG